MLTLHGIDPVGSPAHQSAEALARDTGGPVFLAENLALSSAFPRPFNVTTTEPPAPLLVVYPDGTAEQP